MPDTPDETDDDTKVVRPFAEFLLEQRGGALHRELGEILNQLTEAVATHDKGGSVSLTIKVKPGGGDAVIVTDEVKAAIPEGNRGSSMFFVDDSHNLRRDDPRQPRFDFRTVDTATGELRDVTSAKEA